MKVFLLGASGYIGSEVLKFLIKEQHDILALEHQTPLAKNKQLKIIRGDLLTLNLDSIINFQPEVIIHCCRLSGRWKIGRYLAAIKGYIANKRLIHALKQSNRQIHIIYVSGSLMYGDCKEHKIYEDNQLKPLSFAKQYIIAEYPFLKTYKNITITLCRPAWIVGNRSWFKTYYLNHIKQHKSIPCYGIGNNLMNIITVQSCAKEIISLINQYPIKAVKNIVQFNSITQKTFCDSLAQFYQLPITHYHKKPKRMNKAAYQAFQISCNLSSHKSEAISDYNVETLLKKESV